MVLVEESLRASENGASVTSMPSQWHVRGAFPVALRRAAGERLPTNAVGVFLTQASIEERVSSSTSFWQFSRLVNKETARQTPHIIELVGMLQFIPSVKLLLDTQRSSTTAGREFSFNTSNLGRMPTLPERCRCPAWTPTDVFFSQQVHAGAGSAVSLGAVTYNGRLQLAWNAPAPVVPASVTELQAAYVARILAAASEPNSSGLALADLLP